MKDNIKNTLNTSDRLYYALGRFKGIGIETGLKPYLHLVKDIKSYNYKKSSREELKTRIDIVKAKVRGGIRPDILLAEVYAVVAEVCRRMLAISPYTEQLIGAVALARGKLAQMQNGEGKTLVAVFPAVLYSLCGMGVHILTANDYLAKRDSLWMKPVYTYLGITCSYIQERMSPVRRRQAYLAGVTYLTAEQGGFDLLRDDRCRQKNGFIQRKLHLAIVDEADFIMIDQARFPLVTAGQTENVPYDPYAIETVLKKLKFRTDFLINEREHHIHLTPAGERKVLDLLLRQGSNTGKRPELLAAVHVALYAHYILQRDVDYIVKRGKIVPVDEVTGRAAFQKHWPYGIGRALQAKEGLALEPLDRILGAITIQNYLKLYPLLCAMTATAVPVAGELARDYGLHIVIIPPHRPVRRIDLPDLVFANRKAKTSAIIAEIGRVHRTGQPILVGTASVKESEKIAALLKHRGVLCRTLNAKNPRGQAELLAGAGAPGAVTVSTHMAGRGTDIKLGGKNGAHKESVLGLGGLYVIGTSRHYSARVDNQLRGRCGRHGEPGVSRFFVSLQDTMISRYGIQEFIPRKLFSNSLSRPVAHPKAAREIVRAQSIIEDQHAYMRNTLRRYSLLIELERRQVQCIRSRAILRNSLADNVLLFCIDNFWADHLAFAEYIKQGMHLYAIARDEPLLVFIRQVSDHFVKGLEQAYKKTERMLRAQKADDKNNSCLWNQTRPGDVRAYVINDFPLPIYKVKRTTDKELAFLLFRNIQAFLKRCGSVVGKIIKQLKKYKKAES